MHHMRDHDNTRVIADGGLDRQSVVGMVAGDMNPMCPINNAFLRTLAPYEQPHADLRVPVTARPLHWGGYPDRCGAIRLEGHMPTIEEYRNLPLVDAARMLSEAADHRVTVAMLQADVAAGAPTNPDGTIDLIAYAAWLLMRRRDRA